MIRASLEIERNWTFLEMTFSFELESNLMVKNDNFQVENHVIKPFLGILGNDANIFGNFHSQEWKISGI